MGVKKIGRVGDGGHSLSAGHVSGKEASLRELWRAVREELDAMKADQAALKLRLDNDGTLLDDQWSANLPAVADTFVK